ncbi:uncharacterized protein LOC126605589 isoform X3 [Malus sylvestris]|uniref:uncharacterized protein LOC126605589 isoform X3 n=1 Tax=Malus sylvestris TaxID=3752 RepID=UPI0021AD2E63|nr:uncharacterized protein LOC126605589 isoform X3 [Malus sylvestris]
MWDRCRVDLGTINAESLKLSNSNPVSGQRRRTKSSEFEPRFTLIPLHVVWFPTSFSEQKLLNPRFRRRQRQSPLVLTAVVTTPLTLTAYPSSAGIFRYLQLILNAPAHGSSDGEYDGDCSPRRHVFTGVWPEHGGVQDP